MKPWKQILQDSLNKNAIRHKKISTDIPMIDDYSGNFSQEEIELALKEFQAMTNEEKKEFLKPILKNEV